jgi:hypothetical protein
MGGGQYRRKVIYNALKVICNENIKRPRNFGDIDSFGDIGTGRNLAKNREIDWIFSPISKIIFSPAFSLRVITVMTEKIVTIQITRLLK